VIGKYPSMSGINMIKIERLPALVWRLFVQSSIVSLTAIACLTFLTVCTSASEQPQAMFVAKALHNLSTIESISTEFTTSNSSSPGTLLRYRYMRSDDGVYLEDNTASSGTPQMDSMDSEYTYHWRKNDGVVHASVRELTVGKENFELRSTPELLIGTRIFDAMGLGLIDVLTDPGIIVDAEAHSVTLIDFVPQRSGGALTVEVHFDPDHGFLPKIIQTTLTEAPTSSKHKYMQRWEVLEYFEIEDGATGESRWFPRKAVLKQGIPNSVTMEVVDAAVNIKIPAETFTPDLPVGSQVYDATKKGSGGSYVVGMNGPELDTRVNAMAQQKAVRSSKVTFVVLNVALILAVIGFIVWKRFRMR
jgi:hypothetical protein